MKLVHITKRPKAWFLKKGGAFSETFKDKQYDLYDLLDTKTVLLSNMRETSKNITKAANKRFLSAILQKV